MTLERDLIQGQFSRHETKAKGFGGLNHFITSCEEIGALLGTGEIIFLLKNLDDWLKSASSKLSINEAYSPVARTFS